jgi:hypothetical protein
MRSFIEQYLNNEQARYNESVSFIKMKINFSSVLRFKLQSLLIDSELTNSAMLPPWRIVSSTKRGTFTCTVFSGLPNGIGDGKTTNIFLLK